MLLLVDNYDSFTYNLYHLFKTVYKEVVVYRNDEIDIKDLKRFKPSGIIISPGPGRPENSGVSIDCVQYAEENRLPLLGVCLGHQVIGFYYGCDIIRAPYPVHGKTDEIFHENTSIFKGLKNPFLATRYHSLIIKLSSIKAPLQVTAKNKENLVMGIAHQSLPIYGVQFHPESFLSEEGIKLATNFVKVVSDYASRTNCC
ncbi:MAG: aminodeoxychorismate/anthranilate synthase component II [Actinobacteria bacterium]|nr:aminodeoxychorismate/anthranilate synthase component II [Actinomycetota bacterium]